jgi:transcriptional regulator with GAF, ATPase, and Fis domain
MGDTTAPRLGPFRLLQRLPGGGQGQVHLATAPDERQVVVKTYAPGEEEAAGMAEASLLGLAHPGLAACIDAGRSPQEGRLYTVTAQVQGRPMGTGCLVDVDGAAAVTTAARLLDALAALHDLSLLHRDLKPDNVLLQPQDGRPVVLDFGLACPSTGASARALAGTPRAMAPELFTGAAASVASDLWAVGLLLAEALLGRELVGTGTAAEMASERAQLVVPEEELAQRTGRPDLARLVARLLRADPAARPDSAASASAGLSDPGDTGLPHTQLLSRRAVALARHDARRAARLLALERGAVVMELPASADPTMGEAFATLAAWSEALAEGEERLAACLAAEQRRPQDVAALAGALARHRPLHLIVSTRDAADATGVQTRRDLIHALRGVEDLTVEDPIPPDAARACAVVEDWIGEAPALTTRLTATPPPSWRELDDALLELVRLGVVSAGPLGPTLDESRLPETWPLAGRVCLPELSEESRAALDLLCLAPRALTRDELETLLGRDVGGDLDALTEVGLVRVQPGERVAPADERLRRGHADALDVPASVRGALALHLAGQDRDAPGESEAAHMAAVLGPAREDQDGADDPRVTALALACASTLRRVGRLDLSASLLERALHRCESPSAARRPLHLEQIDVALRAGAHDRAAAALDRADGELPGDPSLAMRRGRSLALRGRMAEALKVLEPLDPDGLSGEDAVLGLQVRAGVLHGLGRNDQALLDLREALRRQGEAPHRRTMTLLERMGFVERELGQFDRAIRSFERALAMARALGHDALVWSPMHNIGRTIRDRGDKRRGLGIQEDAARLCEETGNRVGLATVLNSLGAGWLTLGRTDRARRHLRRALELARELENPAREAMTLNNLGTALAAEGRSDEALASWARSLTLRDELGDARGRAAVRLTRGPFRLASGALDEARADLLAAQADLEGVVSPQWQVAASLLEAGLALHEDRRDDALRAGREALQRARANDLGPEAVRARALLCRAGDDDLADYDPSAGEPGPWTAEALTARAAARRSAGDTAGSREDLTRAAAVLAESPDGLVELPVLLATLDLDLIALDAELARPEPDVAPVGALLSDVTRDLDRARVLCQVHAPAGVAEQLALLQDRLDAMDRNDAANGLTSLAERMRDLERLAEITKRLSAERDTQKLLDLIIDSAIELTGAARGFLILIDGKAEEFRAARNIDEGNVAHPEFQVSHSVAQQVVRTGEPLLTDNAVDDPRLTSAASISELKLLSILCVPIAWRGRVQGAVLLDHPQVVARFRESHLETVTRLAEQAAIALENARLQHGLEQTNDELEARRADIARLNDALKERLERREAELEQARESLDASQRALGLRYDYSSIITRSPAMHRLMDVLDRVTDTHFPVMILGESGTGKELLARAIHFNGPRSDKNFLSINCAAIAEPLIESELFGSVRGAFTGADRDRKGLFAQADGGTLFLDEIGDMSVGVQSRLLRVLQEGEFLPVGGREQVKVDVRILCATHRQLEQRVTDGEFREDLYYRLAVARVKLPALRERKEDVALLLPHFLELHGGSPRSVDPEALALLESRPWPGNVRELENFVMNLVLFDRDGDHLTLGLVSRLLGAAKGEGVVAPEGLASGGDGPLKARLEAFERAQVQGALEAEGGNKAAAARALGVTVRTLYKMIERLEI